MNKAGRPKKENAIKAGDLQPGLCYFPFHAEKKNVAAIKKIAAKEKVSIKFLMAYLLRNVPVTETGIKRFKIKNKVIYAMKAGDLQPEFCRFIFHADRRIVAAIKKIAAREKVTIKFLMNYFLRDVPITETGIKQFKIKDSSINPPFNKNRIVLRLSCKGFDVSKSFNPTDSKKQLDWLHKQRELFCAHQKTGDKPDYVNWGSLVYTSSKK